MTERQYPPCQGCGGPHRFDTSVPSPLWNTTIRAAGLPDFLCLNCIVAAFVRANAPGFTAELYGDPVNRPDGFPMIEVRIGKREIGDSYGDLQLSVREHQEALRACAETGGQIIAQLAEARTDIAWLRAYVLRDGIQEHAREHVRCKHDEPFEVCGWSSCKKRREVLAATELKS